MMRERIGLLSRIQKLIGQIESVFCSLEEDAHCVDILQPGLAATRGANKSLTGANRGRIAS